MTIYRQGEYVDLCRGPHVPSTGRTNLLHSPCSSGTYAWKQRQNAIATCIYYSLWFEEKLEKNYLQAREEAKERPP